jgi:hypothetical protein
MAGKVNKAHVMFLVTSACACDFMNRFVFLGSQSLERQKHSKLL